ncbi:MAG TPA: hypothetical protein VK762_01475 [Polyangiaceae bacterium]|nr:hypothetical protein [Polyangiaceae bacterium]
MTALGVKRLGPGLRWVVAGAVVLAASGSAIAQQPAASTPPAPSPQLGFERRPQLTPQDEQTQADAILSRMTQAAATVRRQLDTARQARDVVKSLCLSDKLSQIDVAARSAKDRQSALQAAAQRNDVELSNHEFTMLTVLRQRTEQLTAEANQCIGEDLAFVGQTQVETEYPEGLPSDDTTQYPATDPPFVYVPPPSISPTR